MAGIFGRLIAVLVFLLVAVDQVNAKVWVNELLPNPVGSDSEEWIELYNGSGEAVRLDGNFLDDMEGGSKPFSLDGYEIAAYGYLVLDKNTTNIALNNDSADIARLLNTDLQVIDAIDTYKVAEGRSVGRSPDGGETIAIFEQPTKGGANEAVKSDNKIDAEKVEREAVEVGVIKIGEMMACPETGQSEWVELMNLGDRDYSLTNWRLEDTAGNGKTIQGNIGANGYLLIEFDSGILNNDGDGVKLIDNDGTEHDSAAYELCPSKGKSFIPVDNRWVMTMTPTAGGKNIYTPLPTATVKQQALTTSASSNNQKKEKQPMHDGPVGYQGLDSAADDIVLGLSTGPFESSESGIPQATSNFGLYDRTGSYREVESSESGAISDGSQTATGRWPLFWLSGGIGLLMASTWPFWEKTLTAFFNRS